jgi:hypothetical protein
MPSSRLSPASSTACLVWVYSNQCLDAQRGIARPIRCTVTDTLVFTPSSPPWPILRRGLGSLRARQGIWPKHEGQQLQPFHARRCSALGMPNGGRHCLRREFLEVEYLDRRGASWDVTTQ